MKRLRCAIYTRKSSEEGLDQSFNSLDAQREACEAYILSQKGEGWAPLPARYEDGGYSGGTMARPGLQQLLADVEVGKVDIVIVYKVDRLTRALADFAKIVEILDRSGASFVSVTQAFNTTSSMGRLTLNVLLSFAQFEREVTGERIRDKIAASKAKGMWMGGTTPLGYEASGRTLAVVEAEAEIVRHIFGRYLILGSVHELRRELDVAGIRTKQWTSCTGRVHGGIKFGRGALYYLLTNRLYLGEIVHKDKSYPGQHDPIVSADIFNKAQARLDENRVERSDRTSERSPLTRLLFDAAGERMSPVHTVGRNGKRYRYYVSTSCQTGGERNEHDVVKRVSAGIIEELVIERLRAISRRPGEGWNNLLKYLRRVEVHDDKLVLDVHQPSGSEWEKNVPRSDQVELLHDGLLRVSIEACINPRGGRARVVTAPARRDQRRRPEKPLIAALRRAHAELAQRGIDVIGGKLDLEGARGLGDPYLRRIAPLAFLAPDIQRSILEGRQPYGVTLKHLTSTDLPLNWDDQRVLLRFSEPRNGVEGFQ